MLTRRGRDMLTREELIKYLDDILNNAGTAPLYNINGHILEDILTHLSQKPEQPPLNEVDGIRLNYIDILQGHLESQTGPMVKVQRDVIENGLIKLLKNLSPVKQPEQPRREIIEYFNISTPQGNALVAKCKDNTAWILSVGGTVWYKLPPIPQGDDK